LTNRDARLDPDAILWPRSGVTHESAPIAVSVERLRAGYAGAPDVLKDVSAQFRRGEVFVLLGPNGAGKSTLMRTLTGALRPSGGEVRFANGGGVVGLAPQQIALYAWLSPRENCIAFGRLSGLSREACRERLWPALRLTGCEPVAGTPVARLSGGYQRRANIAAALMNDPALLILDEPTSGLDAEGRAHVAAAIESLRAAGAAILLVTHDFDFAERLADRVGVLVGGALVCEGAPGEVITQRLGGGARVEIVLRRAPDAAGRERLTALGAEPAGAERAFRLQTARPRDVIGEIEAAGLALEEWRVRPAGLADVFAAVAGEGAA
jgi:ABC-2 type transport system ATP-binding protein